MKRRDFIKLLAATPAALTALPTSIPTKPIDYRWFVAGQWMDDVADVWVKGFANEGEARSYYSILVALGDRLDWANLMDGHGDVVENHITKQPGDEYLVLYRRELPHEV